MCLPFGLRGFHHTPNATIPKETLFFAAPVIQAAQTPGTWQSKLWSLEPTIASLHWRWLAQQPRAEQARVRRLHDPYHMLNRRHCESNVQPSAINTLTDITKKDVCCSCAVPLAIFVASTTQLDKRAHRNRKAKHEQITHKCRRTCGTCEVQLHTSPPMNKCLDWFQREPFEHSQTRHTNSASTFSGGNY